MHFLLGSLATAVYEYCITFEHEVSISWHFPVTATSLIFLLNRWALLWTTLIRFILTEIEIVSIFKVSPSPINRLVC